MTVNMTIELEPLSNEFSCTSCWEEYRFVGARRQESMECSQCGGFAFEVWPRDCTVKRGFTADNAYALPKNSLTR